MGSGSCTLAPHSKPEFKLWIQGTRQAGPLVWKVDWVEERKDLDSVAASWQAFSSLRLRVWTWQMELEHSASASAREQSRIHSLAQITGSVLRGTLILSVVFLLRSSSWPLPASWPISQPVLTCLVHVLQPHGETRLISLWFRSDFNGPSGVELRWGWRSPLNMEKKGWQESLFYLNCAEAFLHICS